MVEFLEKQAALNGKQVLRVNCDETNIQRQRHAQKGMVFSHNACKRPVLIHGKDTQNGSFMHLTFICDDTEAQTKLPQTIVRNESIIRKKDWIDCKTMFQVMCM